LINGQIRKIDCKEWKKAPGNEFMKKNQVVRMVNLRVTDKWVADARIIDTGMAETDG